MRIATLYVDILRNISESESESGAVRSVPGDRYPAAVRDGLSNVTNYFIMVFRWQRWKSG